LEETGKVGISLIESYNAILPDLAKESRATFIPLPPMPEQHTIDGIHLNAAGYDIWDKAILGGIETALCKSN
jgi:lysophospholipase L1-like esterase